MSDTSGGVALPAPWAYEERLPVDYAPNIPLDDTSEHPLGGLKNPTVNWYKIRNTTSGQAVMIRLHSDGNRAYCRITAVIHYPNPRSRAVTSEDLRLLPIASIEGAFEDDYWSTSALWNVSDPTISAEEPIASHRRDEDFLARVALQFLHLKSTTDNPSRRMAELNDVAHSTAQAWITKARDAQWLPPGRPGRAG